jgi:hypothetical protein
MSNGGKSKGQMYGVIVAHIFQNHFKPGTTSFQFHRDEIIAAAAKLNVDLPKNVGDVLYAFRFRRPLPQAILATAPAGLEWIIELHGQSTYQFKLGKLSRIVPHESLAVIEIPDATPDIVLRYTQTDEQALLAKLRYNRLIDIFLSITTYSLQNHLRTSIAQEKGRAQIEIDELYVGIDVEGNHYAIPVQAKGGSDQIGIVQARQDMVYCEQKLPDLVCRPVAAQFLKDDVIALFELTIQDGQLKIRSEKHYKLVQMDRYTPPKAPPAPRAPKNSMPES